MKFARIWAMPNKNTFTIKPIKELVEYYTKDAKVIVDPFANNSKIGTITNDLNPEFDTTYNLDAYEFLKIISSNSADVVLYDPPYSPRQVSECYKAQGLSVNAQTTQSSYWSNQKKEIARITKNGGYVITCGWNSGGIGNSLGFELVDLLIVPHGGWHNDTIVTVERKTD